MFVIGFKALWTPTWIRILTVWLNTKHFDGVVVLALGHDILSALDNLIKIIVYNQLMYEKEASFPQNQNKFIYLARKLKSNIS